MEAIIAAQVDEGSGRARRSTRAARRALFGISALLFAASATATILRCASMSAAGEMPMPGGRTMSMVWMVMPGETWLGAGAAFLGMWTTMMVAMMLPSLVPTLWRHIEAAGDFDEAGKSGTAADVVGAAGAMGAMRAALLAARIGAGYFSVWIVTGVAVFPMGVVLAALVTQEPGLARAVPIMAGVVVLAAGALQFTGWKAHQLALCRQVSCSSAAPRGRGTRGGGRALPENAAAAVRCGLRLAWIPIAPR
ncbi:MAG: DUF2182 domain-containing protein [Steroidobacteraceae bacterium]